MQTINPASNQQPLSQNTTQTQPTVDSNANKSQKDQRSKSAQPKAMQATPKKEATQKTSTKVPESTDKVLIFPLQKGTQWTYDTKAFAPEKVKLRCTLAELNEIFADIYKSVDNFKYLKAAEKKGGLFSCFSGSKPTAARKETAAKIQPVLSAHAAKFNSRGLNVCLNSNCVDWIELQLDYQSITNVMSGITNKESTPIDTQNVDINLKQRLSLSKKAPVEPYKLGPSKSSQLGLNPLNSQPTADTKTSDNTPVPETTSPFKKAVYKFGDDVAPSGSDLKPNPVQSGAPGAEDSNENNKKIIFGEAKKSATNAYFLEDVTVPKNGQHLTYVSEEFIYGDAKHLVAKRTMPTFQSNFATEEARKETQAEDVMDDISDDENGPAMNYAHESTDLHQSSVKRHAYITRVN